MSINKVILVGNVGKDPEVRHLESSVSVASFPLATSETYTNKGGEKVTQTEWHNIVCWRGLATVVEKYVKKGSQLYIEGRIRTRSYEQDGVKKYMTEIYADELQMLGKKMEGADIEPVRSAEKNETAGESSASYGQADNSADDLPF
jgi:single-strand DNA-binding protein